MSEHDRSTPRTCTVSGCRFDYYAKGFCKPHYDRLRRRGTLADRPNLTERFLAKLGPRPEDGSCWEWQGARASAGHAVIWDHGRQIRASHVSWELYRGPVPPGMWVLHRCDNGPCVEPAHLFLGTAKDNTRDMMRKGRQGRTIPPRLLGESHPNAKVTNRQVISIKRLLKAGMTLVEIAALFDISLNIIQHISSGKTWAHLRDYQ